MRNQDRFRGCLIGGAAGDALGYAVEFSRESSIFARYGKKGITEYELYKGKAIISDDTQMTLFTAAGLLAGRIKAGEGSIPGEYPEWIYRAYRDWLKTQRTGGLRPGETCSSWLMEVPELFARRAPGNTCLGALESGKRGSTENPVNHSKGCGGVMRAAPVGLFFNDRETTVQEVAALGAEAAAITHGHILGWLPGASLAQIVHEVSQDDAEIRDAVMHSLDTIRELWPETEARESFIALITRAVTLAEGDAADLDAIHELGEGWVGDEALAIAVYCAVRYKDDFDGVMIAAVNHNGDSDSTGAVAGNILGAKLGLAGIPEKYTKDLELKEVILEIADDLYHGCGTGEGGDGPVRAEKYTETGARPRI